MVRVVRRTAHKQTLTRPLQEPRQLFLEQHEPERNPSSWSRGSVKLTGMSAVRWLNGGKQPFTMSPWTACLVNWRIKAHEIPFLIPAETKQSQPNLSTLALSDWIAPPCPRVPHLERHKSPQSHPGMHYTVWTYLEIFIFHEECLWSFTCDWPQAFAGITTNREHCGNSYP